MGLAYDRIDNFIIMSDIDLDLVDSELKYFKTIMDISNHIIFYDQIKKIPNMINRESSILSLKQIIEMIEKS